MNLSRPDRRDCCKPAPIDLGAPKSNVLRLFISGYNYMSIPVWFDAMGMRMQPIKTSMRLSRANKHRPWIYEWTFYKPITTATSSTYTVSTQGNVCPVIHVFDYTQGMVSLTPEFVIRHNGYTVWKITV